MPDSLPSLDELPPRTRLRRLVKAARELGGFDSALALARAIDTSGLGVGPVRAIEQGKRWPTAAELRLMATVCGVDESFFYMALHGPDLLHLRLRRLRELRALTHGDLATALTERGTPTSEAQVVAWEEPAAESPSDTQRALLAIVLDVPVDELDVQVDVDLNRIATLEDEVDYLRRLLDMTMETARTTARALEQDLGDALDVARVRLADAEGHLAAIDAAGRVAPKLVAHAESRVVERRAEVEALTLSVESARAEAERDVKSRDVLEQELEARATGVRRSQPPADPAGASRRGQRRRP